MNDTYEEFLDYLHQNKKTIANSLVLDRNSLLFSLYSDVFEKNFVNVGSADFNPGLMSATDSSEFVRELYNGKKIILIRSYTKMGSEIYTDFLAEVINVHRDHLRNFTILLMEHSEHRSILKSLEHGKPDYILVDGSLIGRLSHENRKIIAEKYENFMDDYFETLGQLVEKSLELGVPLIFIAKSSESTQFKKFLLNSVDEGRKRTDMVINEMKSSNTDHFLVKSLAGNPGMTAPLIVPREVKWKSVRKKLNVITTHALPREHDLPIKVDIVIPEVQELEIETPDRHDIPDEMTNMVFWGYGGLKTHNIWLAEIDRLVKFSQKEVEGIYMKAFEREIGVQFYETRGERRARLRI